METTYLNLRINKNEQSLKMVKSRLQTRLSLLILSMFLVISNPFSIKAQDIANGEKIFKANCTSCHVIGDRLIGPNLVGVKDRWKGREPKLYAFVKNSQEVIKSGDPYANKLYKEYGEAQMTPMNLSEAEIKDVLEYAHTGGGAATEKKDDTGGGSSFVELPKEYPIGNLLFIGILVLMGAILFIGRRIMKPRIEDKYKENKALMNLNALLFPVGLILFFAGILYEVAFHTEYIMPAAASDIGLEIDQMFNNTMYVTLVVFIVCQILIFAFTFMYRQREGNRALHYSHNDKLELIWTSAPAVVLAWLVLFGFKTWNKATGDLANVKGKEWVECFAYQFAWEFRYPGPDGILGRTDFRLFSPENPLGLDFKDPHAQDDFITKELHLPVGKQAILSIRSKDVLHAAYFPHFRAQIYASPGLENRIQFMPLYTTSQMRDRIGKENFNFELACNQLCGSSHFNMRRVVVIDTKNDYAKWQAQFKPAYDAFKPNQQTATN